MRRCWLMATTTFSPSPNLRILPAAAPSAVLWTVPAGGNSQCARQLLRAKRQSWQRKEQATWLDYSTKTIRLGQS
eukprot:gene9407-biopygen4859